MYVTRSPANTPVAFASFGVHAHRCCPFSAPTPCKSQQQSCVKLLIILGLVGFAWSATSACSSELGSWELGSFPARLPSLRLVTSLAKGLGVLLRWRFGGVKSRGGPSQGPLVLPGSSRIDPRIDVQQHPNLDSSETRAGFFRQGILSVMIKPNAKKSQYFMKGSMPCSVAPEVLEII